MGPRVSSLYHCADACPKKKGKKIYIYRSLALVPSAFLLVPHVSGWLALAIRFAFTTW